MIGKNFGSYKIESKIGEGGMGVVYRAQDTELDRPVAIKMVLSSDSDNEESVARFMREAKAASRLQHPAIMTIYQFGVQDGTRYLVMEFIEGKTLKRIINNQPLPINQLCEIAVQVADALSVAHEKGVIHRDMKAENVMVTPRGHAKILDFGLAKMKDEDVLPTDATVTDMYKTQAGTVLGTISHMSPEQAMGHEVDGKADVFSFGVVLYEMTTGFSPFMGPTPQATLARLLNQAPRPVVELNPTTPQPLEQLINRCLEKDPLRRPTAKEVTLELKRIQASLSARDMVPAQMQPSSGTSGSFPSGSFSGSSSGSAMRNTVPIVPISSSGTKSGSRSASSVTPPSGSTAPAAPITPEEAKRLRLQYTAVKVLRWGLSIFTLTLPLSFFIKFLVVGGVIKQQFIYGTKLWSYVEWICTPAQTLAGDIFNFKSTVNGWDFVLIGLAVAAFALRHLVLLPVDKLEQWAKTKVVRSKGAGAKGGVITVQDRVSNQRLAMLREYSEAQRVLQQGRRHLAFLSVDIVGSTKMKIGEDKLVIEHAFAEYKKFVERILKGNNLWKVAWTPDGIMCAFTSAEEASRAAQTILSELEWFNDGVHRLRTPFNVRCGLNTGEVIFPDDKAMEEISDEAIDVAGHMQKYAAPSSLWTSKEVLTELESSAGFEQVTTQMVDGRVPYEWKLRTTAKAVSSGEAKS
ncbi:MAG TPA: protein kinase [Terriglobales bacterium]|nr:protein kinase [Terriglobales bacterium]